MPGCKGVLISHGTEVSEKYRRKGIARKMLMVKDRIANDLQVGTLLATVRRDNIAQFNLLFKSLHWYRIDSFVNRRTSSDIDLWVRRVQATSI